MHHLRAKLNNLRAKAVAESTARTRAYQQKDYRNFCADFGLQYLPATVDTLSLYIAHLFDRLEFSSICNYLAAISSLHIQHDLLPPDLTHPLIKTALEGARRQRLEHPLRKEGITAKVLELLGSHCHVLEKSGRIVFWAASLTHSAFCSLLRSSNLFAAPRNERFLRVRDVKFYTMHATLSVPTLKTNKYKSERFEVSLRRITEHKLCPFIGSKKSSKANN